MTEVARLLLDGIDEDAVDFRPTYDGTERGAGRAAGGVPQSARQRLAGHRRRHGDLDPAAQRRRTLRRRAVPDRQPEGAQPRRCSKYVKGPDFPTGGIIVDHAGGDRRGLRDRPRLVPRARALGARKTPAAAPTSIVITEIPWLVQKSRLVEKIAELLNDKKLPLVADVRDESAEDVRLVIEPRVAHGRCRAADGVAVQADRAGKPHPAQHERAGRRAACRRCMGLAEVLREWLDHRRDVLVRRSKHRLARDRASPGSARRLPGRLSQPRQGHQDHPQRGRAQARPDEDLQALRRAGRRHPQHAPAQFAQARGDGDPRRGQGAARGEGRARRR